MKHRIGIYLIYDKDGIVDDYIFYYLEQLKSVVSRIVVVCNGYLTPESRNRLESVTSDIFCRENIGFDAWGYKAALEYIGWDTLLNFDELVITNYTIFGPFYPFEEMFRYMELHSSADFWGVHRHSEDLNAKYFCGRPTKYGYLPEYPLSNFWVIRSTLLHSYEFKKYWDQLPPIKDYIDACIIHEPVFTKTMCDAGYTMDAYSPEEGGNICPSPTILNAKQQLEEERLPVLRRRVFFNPLEHFLAAGYGGEAEEILQFIKQNTGYNTDLMFQNLIRTVNQYDLYCRFNWNYIVPTRYYTNQSQNPSQKIALVIHIHYSDLVEKCKEYALNFPVGIPIFITTTSQETKQEIEKQFHDFPSDSVTIQMIPNRGRDISALLIGAKDFLDKHACDYICFFHDKKMTHTKWQKTGEEFAKRCYQAIMFNEISIQNIITLFDENPRLGLLSAQPPYHGEYYHLLGGSWTGNFKQVKKLSEELGLHVDISEDKPPVSPYGTCFWFRRNALQKLFEHSFSYEDFPEEPLGQVDNTLLHAIERLYSFVAQDAGYYPAYVLTEEQAQTEITNVTIMLQKVNQVLKKYKKPIISHRDVINKIDYALKTSIFGPQPKEVIKTVYVDKTDNRTDEDLLEQVSTKLMVKKIIKRMMPKKIWAYLNRKKWERFAKKEKGGK